MQTDDRSWLPTSPRERVFLFSLSLSLMLNTTVVLLLVTGDLPRLADLQAKPTEAFAQQADKPRPTSARKTQVLPAVSESIHPVVVKVQPQPQSLTQPLPEVEVEAVPEPVVQVQAAQRPTEPTQHAQPTEDEDEPATFFGIRID